MFRKMTVLAMALGVVAALVMPASAGAKWKHDGFDTQQDFVIGLTGQARFQSSLGGVECQVTSRARFTANRFLGHMETFGPDPANGGTDTNRCAGLGGLAFCQIHNQTPIGLSWEITTTGLQAASILVERIHSQATGGFCPASTIELTGGWVTATVDNPNAVSTVTLSGVLTAHIAGSAQNATISGTLHVEAPNAGTYGI
jgi:hypothetical protein